MPIYGVSNYGTATIKATLHPCFQHNQRERKTERETSWKTCKMSLLSDLVNLNLSETTEKIIAEYVWWVFLHYVIGFLCFNTLVPFLGNMFYFWSSLFFFLWDKNSPRFLKMIPRCVFLIFICFYSMGFMLSMISVLLCVVCCPVLNHCGPSVFMLFDLLFLKVFMESRYDLVSSFLFILIKEPKFCYFHWRHLRCLNGFAYITFHW